MKVVTVEEKQKKCGGIGGRGKSWKFGVVVEGKPRQESVNLAQNNILPLMDNESVNIENNYSDFESKESVLISSTT